MSQVTNFTQPDSAPSFFIDFLEFLDKQPGIQRIRSESNKKLKLVPGSKVLDVGCGIGGATIPIADITGATGLAAGVDISSEMIKAANSRSANRPGVEFQVCDANSIPYPDGFFDAARSERLFLYLPDRVATVRHMMRVVKPGGQIILIDTDFDATAIYSKKIALARKMTSIVAATMPNPNSARDLPAIARQAGLKNIQVETLAATTPHEFFLRAIAGTLKKAVESGQAPASEVEEFLEEQASLHVTGDFFQAWLFVSLIGNV